ncbi:thiamine pyrophosphate-binding protein [Streptomyces sp. NPDC086783]|uniref:thiamine pyrophosphate-binding protein n=1 Tax=Streptomyces sp. NPDC086783 TaxID=3365758 RepID=UPI0038115135
MDKSVSHVAPAIVRKSAGRTAADAIVETLVAAGVDTFFGVPGGPVMPLFDAVVRHPGARLVESRHESTAIFSAMGYWVQTGRVPGVLVTAGPGGTNAVTGVAAAHFENVPLIVLCGDVVWAATGRIHLQDMGPDGVGIETVMRHITRAALRLPTGSAAVGYAGHAVTVATNRERPGPVLLVVPRDRASAPASTTELVVASRPAQVLSSASLQTITDVARRLAGARRPLVVVGSGCHQAAAEVQGMVEALRVPFVTTPRAKGIVGESHELSLRTGGMAASWWARRYVDEGVDVALVLGTDLDDVSVGPTPYVEPDGELIHVDLNPMVFGRSFETCMGVVADVRSFAADLASVSKRNHISSFEATTLVAQAKLSSPFDTPAFSTDSAFPIAPHRAVYDLEQAAGPDARFVTDIGEHMLFALHYLTARDRNSFGIHLGLGSMASGIGSAIGRAFADPSSLVVCICGDGCMQMAGSELLVAVEHQLPVLVAVFNDGRYNMVYHGYKQEFGRQEPWAAPFSDFSVWASSMGIPSRIIERPGQITPELIKDLMVTGGPALLDIRHDPSVRIKGAGRVEALQQMSHGGGQPC